MIFVGVDWAEAHHDVHLADEDGVRLAKARLPEGVEGIARFHELVGAHVEDPADVVIGIETERGLFVAALVAAGYGVYAVNPMSTSRYRDRHSSSGAKSDAGDAQVLSDMVRTDRHNHRLMAGDSEAVEAIKILARAHQSMVWSRGRQTNLLRSTLREFTPPPWSLLTTWPAAMPSRCCASPPHRPSGGACRARRLPRLCAGAVASGASTSGRPRSRAHCGGVDLLNRTRSAKWHRRGFGGERAVDR